MEWALGDTIAIRNIAAHYGAEAHEIEIRVLQLEWIERPLDETDPATQGVLALKEFQAAADAHVLKFRQHCSHVRMEKLLARTNPSQCHRKADQARAVESAENLSASVVRNHEKRDWNGDGLAPGAEFET